ncbi:hypothetical protein [Fodinicola acaciae]|uniref:hypothetical protein n=1 Tax=Fodinicola acaciae TaxID=2681555 RepID=UPI0013D30969|nr:hypothetical protein [Fodinicola acaciae]
MLMLALPYAVVNHLVIASDAGAAPSPLLFVGLLVLAVVALVGWGLRRIRPVLVLVADLFRMVVMTALTLVVVGGAVVVILVTAVTH